MAEIESNQKAEKQMRCWRCHGTGQIHDPLVLGQSLRKLREEAKITLHRMADVLGISAGYLSDLENGKRGWLGEVSADRYCDALDAEIARLKE